jgi:hypothetical protein
VKPRRTAALARAALGATLILALPRPALGQETARLAVPDSGVGSEVVDRELEGEADRFEEGGQVVFWTRVVGGAEGQRILHAWRREGDEEISIGLTVGGPHWRTFSRKTMHRGSAGKWTVEARDTEGRVLARAEFECVVPGALPAVPPDAP